MARRKLFTMIVVAVGLSFAAGSIPMTFAQPQSKSQRLKKAPRNGFFERIFGEPRPKRQAARKPGLLRKLNPFSAPVPLFADEDVDDLPRKPKRVRPVNRDAPVAPLHIVVKDENARKVMVVGDFVAGGLAWGLEQALSSDPGIVVIDKSNAPSGLVRTDRYDWTKSLTEFLNSEQPDMVIVVLGINDRQQMRQDKKRLPPRSEGWEKVYAERVESVAETLKVYGRPFVWLSAPPVRASNASGDMAYFNGLFKPRVEGAGGSFVDIWNGFTNASGQYITSGPDIEGQVRALRTSDGVNFTRAGRLKLSFYVEREVREKIGGSAAVALVPADNQTSHIEVGPDGEKRLVGPIISLTDPLPGAETELAGAPGVAVFDASTGGLQTTVSMPAADPDASVRYKVVVKGEALPAVAGRVDDFAWPPGARLQPKLPAASAAAAPAPETPAAN